MIVEKLGDEILVNTAVAGSQYNAQITALVGGGFVVTWHDGSAGVGGATGDSSSLAVKAQVFSASGAKVGGEILVNTATLDGQLTPQVTALAGGGFVITWEDESQGVGGATGDASGSAVKAQVFTAAGAKVGGEILVNTAVTGDQAGAKVTALPGGGFVVAWEDYSQGSGGATGDGSGSTVKAQLFTAAGVKVGSEIRVNTAVAGDQLAPEITPLSGGGFVVVWQDASAGVGGATGDSSGTAVKAQVFSASGTKIGGEILVNTATVSSQEKAQVTALSNGGFVVTWQDLSQGVGGATGDPVSWAVKAQVFSATGSKVGGEILVNTATANNQIKPDIAALPGGGFVVTWEDYSQGSGGAAGDGSGAAIKAQIFTAAGAKVGGEILVNTATAGNQHSPQVTAVSSGGFVVTWQDESLGVGGAPGDSSSSAVKAQAFTATGARIGGEMLVNTATASVQMTPLISSLPDGGFAVAWTDLSQGVGGATGDTSGFAVKAQVFSLVNAPPTLAGVSGTTAFLEGVNVASLPVVVASSVTVADADNATLASATVSITGGFRSGEDILGFVNSGSMGNITGSYNASTGVLTLTSAGATATLAQWQAALRAVTYVNTSETPNTTSRTVSFVVNDGIDPSQASSRTVTVTARNDAPSGADASFSLAQNASRAFTAADFGFSDPDGNVLQAVVITTLPSAGALTLNGAAVTAGQAILASDIAAGRLVYTAAASATSFTFQVRDNGGTANGGANLDPTPNTITFNVSAAPPPPPPPPSSEPTIITSGSEGTPGNDVVRLLDAQPHEFRALDGDDDMQGGPAADFMHGNGGADTILGGGGSDTLHGGQGNDVIRGQDGNDDLYGDGGDDQLFGDAGDDRAFGGDGNDTVSDTGGSNFLRGGAGNDLIMGGSGFDDAHGNEGDDTVYGGLGNDWVVGGKDNDLLFGDGGNDIVLGNMGDDTCEGGSGADTVRGGQGNDVVRGGAGNDWLSGDRGDDTLTGGSGADTFHTWSEAGLDIVTDFNAAEGDRVQLLPGTEYTLKQKGADVVIDMGGGNQMILLGVKLTSLPEGWIFGA